MYQVTTRINGQLRRVRFNADSLSQALIIARHLGASVVTKSNQ